MASVYICISIRIGDENNTFQGALFVPSESTEINFILDNSFGSVEIAQQTHLEPNLYGSIDLQVT